MICQQFIYGLFNDYGYKTIKTDGVDTILSKQSFQQLKGLRLEPEQQSTIIQMHFQTEDAITVTLLQRTNDKYGRTGILNHTIIIKTADYLNHFPPSQLVKNHFINNLNSPPNLQPLIIE